jgi:hypothetical protein
VNGLYKFARKEILIHNRNFSSDNQMMFTAIHELAHHVCFTELGQKGSRVHTTLFWSTFHDLLDTAEELGIYTRAANPKIKDLIEQAKVLDRQIAKLQRDLGDILINIADLCEETGSRSEDVFERDIGLSPKTAHNSMKAASLPPDADYGQDIQALAIRPRDPEVRAAIIEQSKGKSIVQIKQQLSGGTRTEADTLTRLMTEKARIEKTINTLSVRLRTIVMEIDAQEEAQGADRKSADKIREGP